MDFLASYLDWAKAVVLSHLLSPAPVLSLSSLYAALVFSAGWVLWRHRRRARPIRARLLVRALFPRKFFSTSSLTDAKLFVLNTFVFGLMAGWIVVSSTAIAGFVHGALASALGGSHEPAIGELASRMLVTLVLFLAYELGYWTDHTLSHRIPFLWEFHKTHHSAEVLTPLTIARMHPVDAVVYQNIQGLVLGIAAGAVTWAVGRPPDPFEIGGSNLFIVSIGHLWGHLQHSHIWLPFRGIAGRVLASPAHHQLHHSTNPAHFNKNMGNFLSLWDWLFGTLLIPDQRQPKLNFGVEPKSPRTHTLHEELAAPLGHAVLHLMPKPQPSPANAPGAVAAPSAPATN